MGLLSAGQFLAGLRDARVVYYRGERVGAVPDHPELGVVARHVAIDFELAEDHEHRDLARDTDAEVEYSAYYRVPRNPELLATRPGPPARKAVCSGPRSAADVVDAPAHHGDELFQSSTNAAVANTDRLGAELSLDVGGLDVGKGVVVELGDATHRDDDFVIPIRWRTASQAALFPSMEASIEVSPLSDSLPLTQLSLVGRYEPPLGVVGALGDAVLGHRLAEAAVRHFVRELAQRLEAG